MSKHFILTSGRSGSNYLSSLLNNHPHVINYGEVLGEWTTGYKANKFFRIGNGSASHYLDFIYSGRRYFELSQVFGRLKSALNMQHLPLKQWDAIQSYGVKDFAVNLINRGASDYLSRHPDIKVISLYRENALRRYASIVMLDETGVVSSDHAQLGNAPKRQAKQVYLPPDQFISGLRRTEKVVQDQLDIAGDLPPSQVLCIRYEDLFSSTKRQREFSEQIFDFIGVKTLQLEGEHKKLNTTDLKGLIKNYDEIFEICRNTKDERYFYY